MRQDFRGNLMALAIASALGGTSGLASAAGFALIEQSGSAMGNAFAGAAATAEDASTIFFNPAGLTKLKGPQFALAGHVVAIKTEFSNNGSSAPFTIASLGSNGGNAGDTVFIPNAYFSMPVNEKLVLGIGLNAPFGLATEYDADWVGRFQGIKSEIMTVNVNPTIAYQVNDAFSVGFGVSYQQFDAELTNKVNGVVIGLPPGSEANAKVEGDDDGFGWNAGVLFNVSDATRVGVSYRSIIDYTIEGNLSVTTTTGTSLVNVPVTADVTMPDSLSVSLVSALTPQWELLADITFTRWSEIQNLRVVDNTGAQRDNLILNFDDTYRYSVGANYKWSDRVTWKVGVAYDESPVDDQFRTVRLPDSDRTWVSLGAKCRVGAGVVDVGYAHLFVSDAPIDQNRGSTVGFGRVVGSYDSSIDILSIQYTHSF